MKYLNIILLTMLLALPGVTFSQNCFSLQLNALEANIGDTVYLDLRVTGFNDVLALQHSFSWDPDELHFIEVKDFNLTDLDENNFGLNPTLQNQGQLSFSWFALNAFEGITLPDASILYRVGFEVKSFSANTAHVRLDVVPTASEVVYGSTSTTKVPTFIHGTIFDSGEEREASLLSFSSYCPSSGACEGAIGSIFVNAIGGLAPYNYSWSGPGNFSADEKDIDNLAIGSYHLTISDAEGSTRLARFEIESSADIPLVSAIDVFCNYPDPDTVELMGISFGGSGYPLIFEWSTGQTDTVNADSSLIKVPKTGEYYFTVYDESGCSSTSPTVNIDQLCADQIPNLYLNLPNIEAMQGDTVVVPISVRNFEELVQLSYSVNWNAEELEFLSFSFAPEFANAEFTNSDNYLGFNWNRVAPLSLANGSEIVKLIFIVKEEDIVANIGFSGIPIPISALRADQEIPTVETNNGFVRSGEIAVVHLQIPYALTAPLDTIYIPLLVSGFEDVVGMQFKLSWDTSQLIFHEAIPIGVPSLSESHYEVKREGSKESLVVSWVEMGLQGQTLEDNAPIFEMGFIAQAIEDTVNIQLDTAGIPVEFITENLEVLPYAFNSGDIAILQNVWPGDTDNNGITDHLDLFNIGLGFDRNGNTRPQPGIEWEGKLSSPWGIETPATELDYRFADTNGDGTIDDADIDAIYANWGNTHYYLDQAGEWTLPRSNEGAPLFIAVDTLYPGTTMDLPIHYGTSEKPVEDVYAVAFSIHYDPALIDPGSVNIDFGASWLGTSDELISIFREHPEEGIIDIAVSRKDGQNISGFGPIARGVVTIEDVIFGEGGNDAYEFAIKGVSVIDAIENPMPTEAMVSETVLGRVTNTKELLNEGLISLYPVPAKDYAWVKIPGDINAKRMLLTDINGRLLLDTKMNSAIQRLDLNRLSSGLYTCKIVTDRGLIIKKLNIKK